MSDIKKHFWMAAVKVTFIIPADKEKGLPAMLGNRETNVLIDTVTKKVTADDIDTLRQIALLKCQEKYNLDLEAISDFLIQNISYLGQMSPKEYLGNTQPSRIETK